MRTLCVKYSDHAPIDGEYLTCRYQICGIGSMSLWGLDEASIDGKDLNCLIILCRLLYLCSISLLSYGY